MLGLKLNHVSKRGHWRQADITCINDGALSIGLVWLNLNEIQVAGIFKKEHVFENVFWETVAILSSPQNVINP